MDKTKSGRHIRETWREIPRLYRGWDRIHGTRRPNNGQLRWNVFGRY